MVRTEAAYWLACADDEARRAAASPTPSVRQTHEAFETAYRDYASSAPERGIVLGPPAPHFGCHVEASADGYRWRLGRSAEVVPANAHPLSKG